MKKFWSIVIFFFVFLLTGCQQSQLDVEKSDVSKQEMTVEHQNESKTQVVLDVPRALEKWKDYQGQVITVEGFLPQNAVVDQEGNPIIRLQAGIDGDPANQFIRLEGKPIEFGGCKAQVSGVIEEKNGGLVLNVQSAKQV